MNTPVVVITGSSRGIGESLAQKFHESGWEVVGCSRTNVQLPYCNFSFRCDVSNPEDVKRFALAVKEKYGTITTLINNAGVAGSTDMNPESSDQSWFEVLNTNLSAVFFTAKHFAPLIKEGNGRIITIASVLALKGVPDQPAYCAAKHGVIGLTRSLAHHYAPRRITVNAICPGWVQTEMALGRMRELSLTEEQLSAGVPLGRMITPREIAEFAYFVSSPSAAMISGQALTIDGGTLA